MTTFKNNARYSELLMLYLDVAAREDNPLEIKEVLGTFAWRFKGGSLADASASTRLQPSVSDSHFPDGWSADIAREWPTGKQARALRQILRNRAEDNRLKRRAMQARIGSWKCLTNLHGQPPCNLHVSIGLRSIYVVYAQVLEWSQRVRNPPEMECLKAYMEEMTIASSQVSRIHVPTASQCIRSLCSLLENSRLHGFYLAVLQVKELISMMAGPVARRMALEWGKRGSEEWLDHIPFGTVKSLTLSPLEEWEPQLRLEVAGLKFVVSQGLAYWGKGERRVALGMSDVERLHQLLMSSMSAIFGTAAQAVVGTMRQKSMARRAVEVAERNLERISQSALKVQVGDEVLVCKGYRRAYTTYLGYLAGNMCQSETQLLMKEAIETAPTGVLDVEGFINDLIPLSAEAGMNAAKMFKVCPAPDVSPGLAFMDRVIQIGNCNVVDANMILRFEAELRSQILRACIRSHKGRLSVREGVSEPPWYREYLKGNYDDVPSDQIHEYLAWEGKATMPEVSQYDPSHWKDSGLGADTIRQSQGRSNLGIKNNMMTRLLFDPQCPMPGREMVSGEHVIKFFIKAEGHKDPARGIFSSNLTDRQAQSWMEKAVETVARKHPSFMIGAEVDEREAKVAQLVDLPARADHVALYYSFDISGWSAKMPAEPQRISHKIWGDLYGGHLFRRATVINEDAYIYLNLDGYKAWFRNTHANLEGFNGKEMTMILVALLSLSVRVWREKVVELGVMTEATAMEICALLFAYIDDGLSRIDLPRAIALEAFTIYKETVIDTFQKCGFSVEVSKCFPSDRFSIFLNEVYIGGRHVVHGVRAAMGISSEPTERHTSLVERLTSVSTGCRGAVMAGLHPLSASFLMFYHSFLHMREWVKERDPVILAGWSFCPRAWGGLGMPNCLQLTVSGSGSAFEEGVATLQAYARHNHAVKKAFLNLARGSLADRTHVGVLTAPLSGKVEIGYMVDSRVTVAVRKALLEANMEGKLSPYATRLLKYADSDQFRLYAEAVVSLGEKEVIQEQMLDNLAEAHPHAIFSNFARRLEKSMTIKRIVGADSFGVIIKSTRKEAADSVAIFRVRCR